MDVEIIKRRLTEIEEQAGVALFELITGLDGEYRDADDKLTYSERLPRGSSA